MKLSNSFHLFLINHGPNDIHTPTHNVLLMIMKDLLSSAMLPTRVARRDCSIVRSSAWVKTWPSALLAALCWSRCKFRLSAKLSTPVNRKTWDYILLFLLLLLLTWCLFWLQAFSFDVIILVLETKGTLWNDWNHS